MPRHTVYGDYQLFFDVYPLMNVCPFWPSSTTEREVIEDLGEDAKVEQLVCMCLNLDVLEDLCELYPSSADTLKILGLKKRKMFLSMLDLQEEEVKAGKTSLSTLVYKGQLRAHSKYRDVLSKELDSTTRELEEEEDPTEFPMHNLRENEKDDG